MRIVTVKMPETMLEDIDILVRLGVYPSRSELIRDAVRQLLEKYRDRIEAARAQMPASVVGEMRKRNIVARIVELGEDGRRWT